MNLSSRAIVRATDAGAASYVVSRPNRSIWSRFVVSAIGTGLAAGSAISAEAAFHITFGTTGDPNGRNADDATFAVETERGDLVVAGAGASRWSDDGIGHHTVPLIARINAGGELQWQRVYHDLQSHTVAALMTDGEEQYIVLKESRADTLVQRVTLRRIDQRGNASDVIGALDGSWVMKTVPVVDADPPYFVLAAKKGSTSREAYAADVQLLQWDLQGRITELSLPAGIQSVDHLLHLGQQDFLLFPRWQGSAVVIDDPETYQFRSDVMRISLTGSSEILFTLVNKHCHHVAASRNRIICAEYVPFRAGQVDDAIVAYSFGGQKLWRHELGSEADPVRQILPLDSGEVVYSFRDARQTNVVGLDRGGGQVWRQTARSAGEYTFLSAIESLRNGRLALLGSTGPWNGFVSTDTNALLLVVDAFASDLTAPPIASAVDRVR